MKSFSKAFGRIVLILTVVIALVASVFVVPKLFGINPYVVLSGSMEPQIHTGAIAFVNTKDTAVKVGDVVTYRLANDELVTHRIIKKDQSEYTFQGDANDNPDARTVTQDQIVGKYLFSIGQKRDACDNCMDYHSEHNEPYSGEYLFFRR